MADEVPVAPGDDLIGQTIDDRYLVRRLLGRGGMGAVYEADHVGLDRRVAIKFVIGEVEGEALARFRREARAIGRVTDDHVIQIFDTGTDDRGRPFLVMEYLEGRDLREVLRAGRLPVPRALAIVDQVLAGLQAIHDAGIVHRDLKPANLLLADTPDGADVVKIMDFGISKSTDGDTETLTRTGKMVGTPQYMAPEQLLGAEVDSRADLYAVGLTLYAMLAGRPPFADASSTMELASMQLRDAPPPLSEMCPEAPAPVVAAVARVLAKAPADRFDSASEFAAALRGDARAPEVSLASATRPDTPAARIRPPARIDVAVAPPAIAEVASAPATRSRRWWPIAVALGVAAAIAVVAIVVLRRDPPPPPAPGDPLAAAHQAERSGDLELAIAHYLTAHERTHDPDLLFRIAELDERMDRTADAVRYFRRYLDEAPAARDRDAVTARIARLASAATAVADASVADGSSGAERSVAALPPQPPRSRVPRAPPGQVCHCIEPRTVHGNWLCHTRRPPRCFCGRSENDPLCSTRFEICHGRCANTISVSSTTAGEFKYTCPDPKYGGFLRTEKPGAPCAGYSSFDVHADPATVANAVRYEGTYLCSYCRDTSSSDAAYASQFDYQGAPGTACVGVRHEDGKQVAGHLQCKPPKDW